MKIGILAFALVAAALSQTAGAITATKEYVDRRDTEIRTNTYTKAETDAKIVELAPAPGNYETVSNRAMSAIQSHQDISGKADKADTYTKEETEARITELSPRTSLEPATNYTDHALSKFAETGTVAKAESSERSDWSTESSVSNSAQGLEDGSDARSAEYIFRQIDGAATPGCVSNIVTKAYVESLGIEAGISGGGVTNIVTNIVTKAYVERLGIEAGVSAETATNISKEAVAHVDRYLSAKDNLYGDRLGVPDGDTVILFADGGRTNVSWSGTLSEQNLIDVGILSNQWGMIIRPAVAIYGGTNVTGIGSSVFSGFPILKTVVFPCVTNIGDDTFFGCSALETIDFPKVSTLVSQRSFCECAALKNISMPSLYVLGDEAFGSCTSLVSVALTNLVEIEEGGWNGGPFNGCTKLESIYMPRVTNIEDYAFLGCHSLREVNFGNTLSVVPVLGDDVFAEAPATLRIVVPDALYDEWKENVQYWSAYLSKIVKQSDWRVARKCDIVNGIQIETDPVWDAAKGGYATTGTVAQVSEAVGTLWSYVYGDSVWIAVTNYMRTVGGVSPSFRLLEVRNGVTNLVYWSKEEITNVTHDLIHNFKTNLEQTVRNAVADMPDKAWSKYQSATGNEAPEGVTIVSTPTIQLTGGGEWYRYVDVSSNSVWFLKSNGLYTFGGDANGYFRILDDEGNATFEVRKTDSYLVDAVASSVHFDGDGNFCVSFESDIQPVIYTTASLSAPNFLPEGDDPNVTVTWTQSGGTYTATLEQAVKGPKLFAYAKVTVQGTTVIRNTAPTDVSGGILCTDGIHKCRPVYNNGSITWEVMP